ncbi:class I SAM-dependent methyltransferase [Paenibacillus puldeungensis]|uniref:Class I SAM-dependent methyltransferase n=1 Tax=Paenibacillus puldeungensis TaxID=696536 RepID=A0ABW3RZI8_9BACL
MDDKTLLEYYLSAYGPEAGPWNLSPTSLYLELEIRDFFANQIKIPEGAQVCNIGIGAGDWDEYLGHCLHGKGYLTSVDINPEICETLKYRQTREQHPNPSTVICEDFLQTSLPDNAFDVATIIGSTIVEIGKYRETLDNIVKILKPGGLLFYMDFSKYHTQTQFEDYIRENNSLKVITKQTFDRFPSLEFYIFIAEKK